MNFVMTRLVVGGLIAASLGAPALASDGFTIGGPVNVVGAGFNQNLNNQVSLNNLNKQTATSGNVLVGANYRVGPVTSGNAINTNSFTNNVGIGHPGWDGIWGGPGASFAGAAFAGPGFGINPAFGFAGGPFNQNLNNRVGITNTNNQFARSGNVTVAGNTLVGAVGSGNAVNTNFTANNVGIGGFAGPGFSGPFAGPRFGPFNGAGTRNVSNAVGITNTNNQLATSGNVAVTGNRLVGPVSSGNAANFNTTRNNVGIGGGSWY